MRVVDDPSGRMDKTMDEMLKTKTRFQHYRPQPCPHFIHNRLVLITIIIFIFFLLFSSRVRCTLDDYLIGSERWTESLTVYLKLSHYLSHRWGPL